MSVDTNYQNAENPRDLLIRWAKRLRDSQFAHSEAAKCFGQSHSLFGIPSVILSTIVGTSVFASLGTSVDKNVQILVGLLSVLAAVLAALQTFLRFSERADRHRSMAARYGIVRRRIEELLAISKQDSELFIEITDIRSDIDKLAEDSSYVPEGIWKRAQRRLGSP